MDRESLVRTSNQRPIRKLTRRKKSVEMLEQSNLNGGHCSFEAFRAEVERRHMKSKLRKYNFPRAEVLNDSTVVLNAACRCKRNIFDP